ncbi:hypothetical protein M0R45_003343 [Rubus argutus]|uniref:Uncharacterized protein n=1 Tax=Rubus argutus TaxID=59490 RepID=A0AAW1YER0_RUBAR
MKMKKLSYFRSSRLANDFVAEIYEPHRRRGCRSFKTAQPWLLYSSETTSNELELVATVKRTIKVDGVSKMNGLDDLEDESDNDRGGTMKLGAAAGREFEQRIELSDDVVDWAALTAGVGYGSWV